MRQQIDGPGSVFDSTSGRCRANRRYGRIATAFARAGDRPSQGFNDLIRGLRSDFVRTVHVVVSVEVVTTMEAGVRKRRFCLWIESRSTTLLFYAERSRYSDPVARRTHTDIDEN
jgi:hypothetical protein